MKWVFILLATVLILLGSINALMSLSSLLKGDILLFVSAILNIISGYAWYLVGEMWEEIESVSIRLLALKSERETEE
ncbi:MAG: hypothetical protein ACE5IF_02695 [Candidatus Bathyarchaeia archaeon]